ncbi:hypothetical protein H0E87_007689, partial [Populus deltoides]
EMRGAVRFFGEEGRRLRCPTTVEEGPLLEADPLPMNKLLGVRAGRNGDGDRGDSWLAEAMWYGPASPLLRGRLGHSGKPRCGGACLVRKRGECGCARVRKKMKMESMGDGLYAGTKRGMGSGGCDRRRKQIKKGSVRSASFGGRVEETK